MKHIRAVAVGLILHNVGMSDARAQVAFNFTIFDVPGATATYGQGINDAGQIVGRYAGSDFISHGFLRSTAANYTTIDFPGATQTSLTGINSSGQIIGFYRTSTSIQFDRSFLRDGSGNFTPFVVPGAAVTLATGLNDASQIVGDFVDSTTSASYGFLRGPAGNFTTIDAPGAAGGPTHVTGINTAGQIVGHYTGVGPNFLEVGFLRSSAGSYTTFSFPGSDTYPQGINDAGQIVGSYPDAAFNTHGFLLSGGIFTTIDVPGASVTQAYRIDSLGQIVGEFVDASGIHGFIATPVPEPGALLLSAVGAVGLVGRVRRWSRKAVVASTAGLFLALAPAATAQVVSYTFTNIDAPGAVVTEAYGINNAGFIVGHFADGTGDHGFVRHPNAAYTTYDVSGADQTVGFDINAAGAIAGSYFGSPPAPQGFLRSPGGTITLLGPPDSVAQGINDAGKVVGVAGSQGYLYTGGNFTSFSVPGSTGTLPFGINNSDHIAGTWQSATGEHGFVRSAAGAYTLFDVPGANNTGAFGINDTGEIVVIADDTGYLRHVDGTFSLISYPGSTLTLPFGINNLGQIVGVYLDSVGNGHAFIATPVPEPGSLLLALTGVGGMWFARRRRCSKRLVLQHAKIVGLVPPKAG